MTEGFEIYGRKTITPEPGRFENVENDVYHREWDALNCSRLKDLKRSAKHCLYAMSNPKPSTPAMTIGSAIHCATLEPELFDSLYQPAPGPSAERLADKGGDMVKAMKGLGNTTEYKMAVADMQAAGVTVLKQSQLGGCMTIRDHLYETPSQARDLLLAKSGAEVSYVVDDPRDGLRKKLRTDLEAEAFGVIVDVKTTRDASRSSFMRDVYSFGYHRTKPFYLDGLEIAEPGKWKAWLMLVIESTAPFEYKLYDLDPAATQKGREEVEELCDYYAQCKASNHWPGYASDVESIGIPNWSYYEKDNE